MADFPSLPLFTDSFIADTTHLTAAETGAYLMLLMCAWRRPNCDLPDDDKLLARWSRCTPRQWSVVRPAVMQFWDFEDELFTQKKLSKVRGMVQLKSDLAARAGRASALKRKNTEPTDDDPTLQQPKPKPKPKPDVEDTSPNGEDAVPDVDPVRAVDPAKLVYDSGKSLLARYGVANGKAGGLITKWRKSVGDDKLLSIIADTGRAERSDPVAFITAACQQRAPPQRTGRVTDAITGMLEFYKNEI